jgi:hypothetical protein
VVDVQIEAALLDVEGLGAVHVRDGNHHEFKLAVHDAVSFVWSVDGAMSRIFGSNALSSIRAESGSLFTSGAAGRQARR